MARIRQGWEKQDMNTKVEALYTADPSTSCKRPLFVGHVRASQIQGNLFGNENRERSGRLMRVLDGILG